MKYTAKYFRDGMPEWKRKKDPITCRFFYRRISFYISAFCANAGISANTVSYASAIVAVMACLMFLFNKITAIIGAILFSVWLIMDCTDGNLARSVKQQPFGEFADAISSYILVGLMGSALGVYAYKTGGVLFQQGNPIIIYLGALASSSDTLMRLVYQKYKATERALIDDHIIASKSEDIRTDHKHVGNFRVRLEMELGIGGIITPAVLLSVLFGFVDVVVLYCFAYYGLSFLMAMLIYVRRAIKRSKETI